MPDSIREKISNQLFAMAQGITVANGFETDMGSRAKLTERCADVKEGQQSIAVWPGGEDSGQAGSGTSQDMLVEMECHAHAGKDERHSTVANRLIADTRKKMETRDDTLVGLITGLQYIDNVIEYPGDGGDIVGVRLSFNVRYKTVRGDPYA